MSSDLLATSSIHVSAPIETVWEALTTPEIIEKYYFGTHVDTLWRVGGPIVWEGEYDGKAYRDHGVILEMVPPTILSHTHFSPLSGLEDVPENYHTLTYRLAPDGDGTTVTLTQDNNDSYDSVKHSEQNWHTMLEGLKTVVES